MKSRLLTDVVLIFCSSRAPTWLVVEDNKEASANAHVARMIEYLNILPTKIICIDICTNNTITSYDPIAIVYLLPTRYYSNTECTIINAAAAR